MGMTTYPPQPFPPSSGKTGDIAERVTELESNVSTLQSSVGALQTGKVNKADIAPTFSIEGVYTSGNLVYYDGVLYEFTANHSAGEWNGEEVQTATIDSIINAINSSLASKQNATDNSLETTDKTVVGGINELKSGLTNVESGLTKVANQLIAQNTRVYFKPNYRNNANANVKTVKNLPANHVGALMTSSGIYVFKSNNAGNGFEVPQGSDLTITNTDDSYTFSCPGAWYTMCLFIFTWDPDYEA